ncbi:MAG: ECF-type sigma factor [Planctomycetota bacterium]
MSESISAKLRAHQSSPAEALDAVLPLVYEDLRRLAQKTLREGPSAPTLQPTAVVHEAYVRLAKERTGWVSGEVFMFAAAVAMRRALIDYSRKRNAKKRRARWDGTKPIERVAIDGDPSELIAVDECLKRLEIEDPESGRVVELVVFGGLTLREAGQAIGISERTAQRRWRFARAWILSELAVGEQS